MNKKAAFVLCASLLVINVVFEVVTHRSHTAVVESGMKEALVGELIQAAHHETNDELRQWLLRVGPGNAIVVITSLDERNDPHAKIRMQTLNVIYSLDASQTAWAATLRNLANSLFHAGVTRSEYIAKSFLMENRLVDAAAEFRQIAQSPSAQVFFSQNPDFAPQAPRLPASK